MNDRTFEVNDPFFTEKRVARMQDLIEAYAQLLDDVADARRARQLAEVEYGFHENHGG